MIEKKINLFALNYENESLFKHCAVEEIFKIYSKFLFNLNEKILRPVLNEFLYDGGAKKVYNFCWTTKCRDNKYKLFLEKSFQRRK